MIPSTIAEKVTTLKVQRSINGAILGAALWVPGSFIEPHVEPGQEEIGIAFEGDIIKIGKATGAGTPAASTDLST